MHDLVEVVLFPPVVGKVVGKTPRKTGLEGAKTGEGGSEPGEFPVQVHQGLFEADQAQGVDFVDGDPLP